MDKNKIYTDVYKVTSYDADPFGYAKPSSLMNYMQDASGQHAKKWGLSVFDLFAEGKTWVISRYHLKIFNRPSIGKGITVKTWPSTIQDYFILREFEAYDQDRVIAKATISVVMIDLKTKRPVPLGNNMPTDYLTPQRALTEEFTPLPKLNNPMRETLIPVMLRDLDANGHVNHVVYAQWALEAVPIETWEKYHLTSIEINYKAEIRHGQKIISRVEKIFDDHQVIQFTHQIIHSETQQELTRLRTTWEIK